MLSGRKSVTEERRRARRSRHTFPWLLQQTAQHLISPVFVASAREA